MTARWCFNPPFETKRYVCRCGGLCLRSPLPQALWLRRRSCWSYMITGFNRILPRMWCKSKLAKCAHHKFEWVETQAWDFRVKGLILWYVRGDQISLSGRIIKCRNGCQFWVICWYVDSSVFRIGKTKLCRCILRRHEEWRMKWIKSFFYKFQKFSTSSRSDFVHIESFSFDLEDSSIFITWEDEQHARKQTYRHT